MTLKDIVPSKKLHIVYIVDCGKQAVCHNSATERQERQPLTTVDLRSTCDKQAADYGGMKMYNERMTETGFNVALNMRWQVM